MRFLPLLAFPLFLVSRAALIPRLLDSDVDVPEPVLWEPESAVVGAVGKLHIVNDYIAPDGYNRSASLINGVYPGPLIRAHKGDHFSLQVLDELTDDTMPLETSIHFHGMFQRKSNWADGVAYVTQCPLRPWEAFTQKFNSAGQTGTYWYHSHYSTQYCDGVRGPLVIYDPQDPLKYLYDVDDENTVITLSDWYHIPSPILGQVRGAVVANSTLINGKGRYPGGPPVPLSVTNVRQGLAYRLRLVATSCDPSFNFSIDGHRMTIIEVDGTEIEPVDVDWVNILAGQRYSVVITADKPIGNYWIRALSSETGSSFDGGQNLAILRYEGAPAQDPTSSPGPYELAFDEGDLHPLFDPAAPGIPELGKADVNIVLTPGFVAPNFTLNGTTFVNPSIPVLLQILSGAQHATDLLPQGSVYTLPPNKVIEISFPHPNAAPGGPHPLHLHGHSFSVVRVANSTQTNFVNPVRRDVVSIGNNPTDNVTIRFVTNNPGPWFLHCHIDWHLNRGFAVVMAESPNRTAEEESRVVPLDWKELCSEGEDWGQTRLQLLGN